MERTESRMCSRTRSRLAASHGCVVTLPSRRLTSSRSTRPRSTPSTRGHRARSRRAGARRPRRRRPSSSPGAAAGRRGSSSRSRARLKTRVPSKGKEPMSSMKTQRSVGVRLMSVEARAAGGSSAGSGPRGRAGPATRCRGRPRRTRARTGGPLRGLPVDPGARALPLLAHLAHRVLDQGGLGQGVAVAQRQQRALDRLVDEAARPHLAGGELLEDVEAADQRVGVGVPAAPRAVVLVVVAPAALLEDVVAGARPGEFVDEVGHGSSIALRARYPGPGALPARPGAAPGRPLIWIASLRGRLRGTLGASSAPEHPKGGSP